MSMRRATAWKTIAGVFLLGVVSAPAQTPSDFFDPNVLHEIRIDIYPDDWETLRARWYENTYYTCDFVWRFRGQTVTRGNIGIRSRGRDSRTPLKPSLRVDFNRYEPQQEFLGLRSIVLKNNTHDASQLRERLAIPFFPLVGLPASREAHARLYVNDQYIGLYIVVEDIRKEFLSFNFGENDGQLWEYNWVRETPYYFDYLGSNPSLYVPKFFQAETHESAPDTASLVEMIRTINQSSDADFPRAMEEFLDLKRVMAHMAVENFVADPDDVLENNLFLYRFERKRLFQWVPWDKDGAFSFVALPISWDRKNILLRRALGFPELRAAYLQALAQAAILAGGNGGWLEQEIQREYEQIREAVFADPNKQCVHEQGGLKPCSNEEFEAAVESLRQFARDRSTFVREQLVEAGFELRVVNGASFVAGPVAPGSLISVFGEQLSTTTIQASALPLPTELGGVSVRINGIPAPLLYVSPGQLNLQVPWTLEPGTASIRVSVNGVEQAPISATMEAASPGIFVVVHADGSLVSSENPATAGEVLIVYANGLGAVTGLVQSGQTSPSDPPARTIQTPSATLAGVIAPIEFSGLTPGFVGLYQINIRVPANFPPGAVTPLIVSLGGQTAIPFFLATR